MKQAAVQTPRSLATGVNVASQTRTTTVKSVAVGEQSVVVSSNTDACCATDACQRVDVTTQVKYEIPEKLSIAGVEAFEEQVQELRERKVGAGKDKE